MSKSSDASPWASDAPVYTEEATSVAKRVTPSARGLWAATGKRTKPVHERDLLTGEIIKVKGLSRKKDEFYPTPPEPTREFMWAERQRLRDFAEIWEPATGDGAMAREIRAAGFLTAESDLVDRGCGAVIKSFYDFTRPVTPAIVTNPPFDECASGKGARWITHALDVLDVEYMALLLNWTWPAAGKLGALWARRPPARVYLMRWRIDFTNQGASPIQHAWFVWDKKYQGETLLRMLDKADARQSIIFGAAE